MSTTQRPSILMFAAVGLFTLAGQAMAFRSGPPAARNGSTASSGVSCRICHGSTVGNGLVEILGAPDTYEPSVIYDLTVRVSDPIQAGAGFQISVEDGAGTHVGQLLLDDTTNTQFNPANPGWVNHTSEGVNNAVANWGAMGNAAEYTLQWQAPASDVGAVTFWAAGNAINNNFFASGDIVYLTNKTATALEPIGACCNDALLECVEGRTQADCEGDGFRYGGDDSTCASIEPGCSPPTGACCDGFSGICTDGVTQNDCEAAGSTYGGDDSTCATLDPACEPAALPIHLELVAEGMAAPIGVTHAGDDSGNLFIVDQSGVIRVVDAADNLLPDPFLDLTDRMISVGIDFGGGFVFDERGLLGLVFHPDYPNNGRFFVAYSAPRDSTGSEPCDLFPFDPTCHKQVISEFVVDCVDPFGCTVADPTSEKIILSVDEPEFNHNAGDLAFGPDGLLYVPLGDGGGAHDGLAEDPPAHGPDGNGQNIETLLGAILRIDVDGDDFPEDDERNYAIPADNPLVGVTGADEIYAYGFRNPFRISFDDGPGGDGWLYVADVGQELFEEVDLVEKGGNYGWVIREGAHCFDPFNPGTPPKSCATTGPLGEPLIDPVSEYTHAEGGLAIIGGFVYRGSRYPALRDRYVYGDFSADFGPTGRLYYFDTTGPQSFVRREFFLAPDGEPLGLFVKGFGEDAGGELYVSVSADLAPSGTSGQVFRIVPPPATPGVEPTAVAKNRFISMKIPPPLDATSPPTAIQVELVVAHNAPSPEDAPDLSEFNGEVRFVNLLLDMEGNEVIDCLDSTALLTQYKCATLGCDPEYRDWEALIGGEVLHVTGDAVIPSSVYNVIQLGASCAGAEDGCPNTSAGRAIETALWGDVRASEPLNVFDVTSSVDTVKDLPLARLTEPEAWLRSSSPQPQIGSVNITDVVLTVDALKGFPYPFGGPAPCP